MCELKQDHTVQRRSCRRVPGGARSHDYWQQASKRGAAKEVRFPGFRPDGDGERCADHGGERDEAQVVFRWCVKKEVVAVNLITGPHSTACVCTYAKRTGTCGNYKYMAQVGRKILTLGEGFTTPQPEAQVVTLWCF